MKLRAALHFFASAWVSDIKPHAGRRASTQQVLIMGNIRLYLTATAHEQADVQIGRPN